MTIDDLKYIFKVQLETDESLFFMVKDGDDLLIDRHSPDKLDELGVYLENFVYEGTRAGVPRFVK